MSAQPQRQETAPQQDTQYSIFVTGIENGIISTIEKAPAARKYWNQPTEFLVLFADVLRVCGKKTIRDLAGKDGMANISMKHMQALASFDLTRCTK